MAKISMGFLVVGTALSSGALAYFLVFPPDANRLFGKATATVTETEMTRILTDTFAREERDAQWAAHIESQWRSFFSTKQDAQSLEPPNIECKRTMCEIRLSARSSIELSLDEERPRLLALLLGGIKDNPSLEQPSLSHIHMKKRGEVASAVHLVAYQRNPQH